MRLSEPTTKIWMKIDQYYLRQICSSMTLVSDNIRLLCGYSRGFPGQGRQRTVGRSTAAVFNDFDRFIFENFRHKAIECILTWHCLSLLIEWQNLWSQCTSNKLYSVQPVIGHHTKISSLSRHDRVVINRLRVGHTRLTNSYLLKGENQPECQACQSALTVKHILIDSTHLSAVRQRYFRVDTLKELSEIVDSRNIIAFIKDI